MPDLVLLATISVGVFVLAALAQAASGFGSALVAVPLLALVIDPVPAVVAATSVSLVLTAGAWRRERQHTDPVRARTLTLAGLVGMPVGLVALAVLDADALGSLIAVVVLLLVAALALGLRLRPGPSTLIGSGMVSGALLTSTGMNGPPLVLALQDLPPLRYRATLQAVFCGQDVVAVAGFVALGHFSGEVALLTATGVVGLPLGWFLGDRVFHRISPAAFRWVVLAGLAVTAVVLLVS